MLIIGIDVGVKNLGITAMEWCDEFEEYRLHLSDAVDVTTFPHPEHMSYTECTLHHDLTYSDYLDHFFQVYEKVLDRADLILIERQPPMGYVVVEQLIFHQYRDKCQLVHPCSVHKFFGWCSDYELRKVQSVKTAMKYVPEVSDYLLRLERAHDVSDSVCFILFYVLRERETLRVKNLSEKMLGVEFSDEYTVGDFITSFSFKRN